MKVYTIFYIVDPKEGVGRPLCCGAQPGLLQPGRPRQTGRKLAVHTSWGPDFFISLEPYICISWELDIFIFWEPDVLQFK